MSSPLVSELLMPAGSLDKLKTALLYGADAVYIGTPDLSLRTKSEFSLSEIQEGIAYAHERGKRVYLTLNLYAHNKDFEKLPALLDTVKEVQPDGVIIADPAVFQYVKQHAPELELHVSTQANVTSWAGVQFWQSMGAKLCVLARELSYEEIKSIREHCPDIKLETFVHGSMCMAYSGRCLMANFMSERGANQGSCANNCRWKYKVNLQLKDADQHEIELNEQNEKLFNYLLEEEFRPGEQYAIEEDEHGTYLMNSRDLCLMPVLDAYLETGIDSLKIEGRNKSLYYIAVVTRAYRAAMDDWARDPKNWKPDVYMQEIETCPSRGYTLAFHYGRLTNLAHNYTFNRSLGNWEFAGHVLAHDSDTLIVEVKNRLLPGDVLEFMLQGTLEVIRLRLYEFIDAETGEVLEKVHAGKQPKIRIPISLFEQEDQSSLFDRLPVGTTLRKERELTVAESNQVRANRLNWRAEDGRVSPERLAEAKSEAPDITKGNPAKSPKVSIKACCARGCNGCLMFWHDPKYEKARARLLEKKSGTLLSKAEAGDCISLEE